ncbi:MAG: HAD family phosphatase [Mycoplasmataceae bacterium]|nr:HAD family phosphatase [Mycoplasmataceae bacterium]
MNLNKNIKVFFIDLDGTLLDTKKDGYHAISKENIDEIEKIKESGVHVVVSTGRSGGQAVRYLDMVKSQYSVTGNGSIILKGNKIIKETFMSIKQVIQIQRIIADEKVTIKLDDSRDAYGSKTFIQRYASKRWNFNPILGYNYELHKKYHKMVIWGKTKGRLKKVAARLANEVADLSLVSSGGGWTLEITHKDATKGAANEFVAKKLGITNKEEMAHLGDSMNDSTTAGHMRLIAMKNSPKSLKVLTKYHGPHYKHAGVAKILRGEYTKK